MRYWTISRNLKDVVKRILKGPFAFFKRDLKHTSMKRGDWVGSIPNTASSPVYQPVKRNWQKQGSEHYKEGAIQPLEYIIANKLDFCEGNVVKYITRWRKKGTPLEDLKKVKHYVEILIEEYELGRSNPHL